VSRAILLCLGYGLFSLLATWFPVVVSQYFIPAQLRSPPRRSGRAPLTHPAPRRHLASGGSGQKNNPQLGHHDVGMRATVPRQHVPAIHKTVPKLRSSQVSTAVPSLSTDGARSQSRNFLAAFPAPILLGFSLADWTSAGFGTIRPSDSLKVICCPC
jgi:hypothetical protein